MVLVVEEGKKMMDPIIKQPGATFSRRSRLIISLSKLGKLRLPGLLPALDVCAPLVKLVEVTAEDVLG